MKLNHTLFILYLLIWAFLAYAPSYRDDWLLENIMVFIAVPIILWAERRITFSKTSGWMLFVFFVLHAVGAHYTYSEMPWFSPITDFFGFERNHYDRLVHFLFGFLLFVPFYELFHLFQRSKRQTLFFTFMFLCAASGVYEMIEWGATEITHPALGVAFLGIQGDQWDSQKDMLCAYSGALFALLLWYRKILSR